MIIARGFAALFTAAIVAAAMPALAQEGGRLRGEMTKLSGDTLTVKTDDGKTADVTLDSGYTVSHAVAIKLADIKPGTFVGVGASLPENGVMKAMQVVVFPANTRASERHGAWGSDSNATMTNAPATLVVAGQSAGKLTLTTGGQNYEIAVPPDAVVVRIEDGSKDLLKPGAAVSMSNVASKDGKLSARAVTVSDDKRYPTR
jgi:carbonic anhydrase/acetyltransferase-like protein (isoleucine patch superfamily)